MLSDSSCKNQCTKVRALIADDSRIVRATLAKHLHALFEFSEAHDGEEAWDALLRDDSIALLITDLTMPRLDGYGLLRRMRTSRSQRLRDMPVVVVSGTDEAEERRLAKEAGATDLITKGMATAPLISRLDLLAQLVLAQNEYEKDQEAGHGMAGQARAALAAPYAFQKEAERRLGYALRQQESFALLNLGVDCHDSAADDRLHRCITNILKTTIRQGDVAARTAWSDFTIATANLEPEAMRGFADRLCRVVAQALSQENPSWASVPVSCGVASLAESNPAARSLHALWDAARRRRIAGLGQRLSGAVGAEEESAFRSS